MNIPIGLQLYSIRDIIGKDFEGMLREVKKMGYDSVEFAGYFDHSAKELKALCDEIGLNPLSTHIGAEHFSEENLDATVKYSVELGLKYVVCPYYDLNSEEDCIRLGKILNNAAKAFKPYGIKVGYHNHTREFEKYNGKFAFDIILEEANRDGAEVFGQVDTYWAAKMNVDPLEYIKSLGDKNCLIHFKEMGSDGSNVEVGTGIIDFKSIVDFIKADAANVRGIIVEQEEYTMDVLESVKLCYKNLSKIV